MSFSISFPKLGDITITTATFLVQVDVDSTAYFVVVPSGDTAPTAAQIKLGRDSTNNPVAAGFSGNIALSTDVENSFSASNLISLTAYDVYFAVSTDSSVTTLSFTTISLRTYYVNPISSSPAWPFGTPNTGAHNFNDLIDGVTTNTQFYTTDTIFVMSGAEIIEPANIQLIFKGTATAYDVNNKPLIRLQGDTCFNVDDSVTFDNLRIYTNNIGARQTPLINFFRTDFLSNYSFTINACELFSTNTVNDTLILVDFFHYSATEFVSTITITDSIFYNADIAVLIAQANIDGIFNISNNTIYNCSNGINVNVQNL